MSNTIKTSETLRDVKYEIRGQLANHADELEKRGYEIISLNIGNGGIPRYYDCTPQHGFQPDVAQVEALIGAKTRAIVVINPNNPSGAVYGRETLQQLVSLAEKHQIVLLADEYIHGMELFAALRLCANVPGQWAVQTALGGFQSIKELVQDGGRLYQQRQVVIDRVAESSYLSMHKPMGAMYAFIKLDDRVNSLLEQRA